MTKCKNLLEQCLNETIEDLSFRVGANQVLHYYVDNGFLPDELTPREEDKLIDVLFECRQFCWKCARSYIESKMSWRFDLLQFGIELEEHHLFTDIVDSDEQTNQWVSTLCLLFKNGVSQNEFADYINTFNYFGVTHQEVNSIYDCGKYTLKTFFNIDEITYLLSKGYKNVDDIELLRCPEIIEISLFLAPSIELLRHLDGDISLYFQLKTCLELLEYEFESDENFENCVQMLSDTKVLPYELENILTSLSGDEELSVLDVLYDDDLVDPTGQHIAQGLIDTLRAMNEAKASLSEENILSFWKLSTENILYVVDNEIDDFDEILPLRLFNEQADIQRMKSILPFAIPLRATYELTCAGYDGNHLVQFQKRGITHESVHEVLQQTKEIQPNELISWLDAGFSLARLTELFDWHHNHFTPQEAQRWKSENFDSATANSWRSVIDDPTIAARRARAGIRPE